MNDSLNNGLSSERTNREHNFKVEFDETLTMFVSPVSFLVGDFKVTGGCLMGENILHVTTGEGVHVWMASCWTAYNHKWPFPHPVFKRILMERCQGRFWK